MAYGYLGQNTPNQTVNNSGVFSITDSANLQSQGKLGGSLELIEEQTVSSASAVDFTSIQENVYDVHMLQINGLETPSSNQRVEMQFSNDSGSSFETSNYQYAHVLGGANGGFSEQKSTSNSHIKLAYGGNSPFHLYIYLYNLGNSSKYSFVTNHTANNTDSSSSFFMYGGGVYLVAEIINGIRIRYNNGQTLSGGSLKLYGMKEI
jgi:hypothetical protein